MNALPFETIPHFSFAYLLIKEARTLFVRQLTEAEAAEKNKHLESLGCHGRWIRSEQAPPPKTRRTYTITK